MPNWFRGSASPASVAASVSAQFAEGVTAWQAGKYPAARKIFDRVALLASAFPELVSQRVQALANGANAAIGMGDVADALAGFNAAMSICDGLPADELRMMRPVILLGLASVRIRAGDFPAAEDDLDEAQRILDSTLDPPIGGLTHADLLLSVLTTRTAVAAHREDWPRANLLGTRSLELATEHLPHEVAPALMNLADIALHTGRLELAEDFGRQALDAFEKRGDPVGAAEMRRSLGQMYVRAERHAEAEPLLTAALAYFEPSGMPHQAAATLDMLGLLAGLHGDVPTARAHWTRATGVYDALGLQLSAAEVRGRHGILEYLAGEHATGEELLVSSAEVIAAHGLPVARAQADMTLAAVMEHRIAHDPDPAVLARALDLAVPSALAIDAVRYTLASGRQRDQWQRNVAEPAMALAFRLAVRADDAALVAELVESRCAGTPLSTDRAAAEEEIAANVFGFLEPPPQPGPPDATLQLGAALATVAAGTGLRVAPPPRLALSPSGGIVLDAHLVRAEQRYGLTLRQTGVIPTW